MKPVPFPTRPMTVEGSTTLDLRIRGAIRNVEDAVPDFQRFERRLRKRRLACLDDKLGGVVVGATWKKLTPLRLLVLMMIVRYRPAREYYYALQSDRDGTLAAWNEVAAEARFWEWNAREALRPDEIKHAQRMLERALRQMARGRRTSYGWVP